MNNKTESAKKTTLRGRQFFLTLSQTKLTVQEVYDKLFCEDKLQHLAVVCETHTKDENKGKHIHVYLSYLKTRELSLRHFDFLQHGVHVERVKNTVSLLAYMNKENECKSNFDVWRTLLSSKATFAKTLSSMSELGYSLTEVQRKYSHELADKPWSTVSRFVHDVERIRANPPKGLDQQLRWISRELIETRLTREELAIFDSDPQFQTLVDYINKVKKFGSQQIHKECCLSIVSAPSTGKTTLLLKLAKHYNSYDFPSDGWHAQHYENNFYSMWTWNEWSFHSVSMEDMLTLTEGLKTDLRVKGSKTFKADRPLLFLLDNETWESKYERRYSYLKRQMLRTYEVRLEAFKVRIRELNFGKQNLFFLQKLFVSVQDDVS